MRHQSARPAVKHRKGRIQLVGNVVGMEDRPSAGFGQPIRAHHADVHPGNGENARTAQGRGGDARALGGFRRQETSQMGRHTDRPHAGPAAAMRNAEGLVQIQMTHVRTNQARAGQSNLRIHIGAIHVNLTAMVVDDGANFPDALFKHAVRAGISHHERGQLL